ncbi:Re/Si-specific NAD(P)(+) transhydrogenase subunit alpha [Micavibrio aeruginosavorus]|uniref:Re/Si-specific NAD(P)(+) transhydrogenase subunit alpha n=1 Tax=Micavibrio aeruginosavorus TaxID=349221 RepID=UPI003F4ACC0A
MTLFIPKETAPAERRVAATPDTVKKLIAQGCSIRIERDAGTQSSIPDALYKDAGATIIDNAADGFAQADIVLKVQAPTTDEAAKIKKGALLVCMMAPYQNADLIGALAKQGIDVFSMELVPRITRAQAMDVLSSQSNLAGYKAVLDATEQFNRAFPMMMTAAGTVPPARVFIMGVGVAGLQAIATAKRLGAIVSATDVRAATKEQVQSLGASFVMVEDEESKAAETAGGYAKEMSDAYKAKQATLIAETIAKQDIVITTALIPGRKAPTLVTSAMVKTMKPGSVIVDLAVEQGGNCELSKVGEVVDVDGVKIVGHRNVPSRLSANASALYAKNLLNLLGLVLNKDGAKDIPWDDDIIKGVALTRDGALIHPQFGGPQPAPKEQPTEKAAAQ